MEILQVYSESFVIWHDEVIVISLHSIELLLIVVVKDCKLERIPQQYLVEFHAFQFLGSLVYLLLLNVLPYIIGVVFFDYSVLRTESLVFNFQLLLEFL